MSKIRLAHLAQTGNAGTEGSGRMPTDNLPGRPRAHTATPTRQGATELKAHQDHHARRTIASVARVELVVADYRDHGAPLPV